MKAVFRIFNNVFSDGEWFVVADVPEYFLNNIHLNDIISSGLLMSLPEFSSDRFLESLGEESLNVFRNKVQEKMEKHGFSQVKAVTDIWYDWMYEFNLTVSARKWFNQPRQEQFYLEFWLENK